MEKKQKKKTFKVNMKLKSHYKMTPLEVEHVIRNLLQASFEEGSVSAK